MSAVKMDGRLKKEVQDLRSDCRNGAMNEEKKIDLCQHWEGSDVTFLVEGQKIYASKVVLSIWSPVFKAMFRGSFKEKGAKRIPLPEKRHSDILKLFELCHIPMDPVTEENVHTVLPLAEEYQMDKVLDQCHRVLLSQERSIQNLITAKRYRFARLEELCLDFVKKTPLSSLSEDDFNYLDAETQASILKFKVKCLEPLVPVVETVRSSFAVNRELDSFRSNCVVCNCNTTDDLFGIKLTNYRKLCFTCATRGIRKVYDAANRLGRNELVKDFDDKLDHETLSILRSLCD